jgi:hypothetical protein
VTRCTEPSRLISTVCAPQVRRHGCMGGQNQGALFDLLGLPYLSPPFKAFLPGTYMSVATPHGQLRACAISYELATIAPIADDHKSERMLCPLELLTRKRPSPTPSHAAEHAVDRAGARADADAARVRVPGGASTLVPANLAAPLIHLKSAARAPSHMHALSVFHDCLTAAEAAALEHGQHAHAQRALRALQAQVAWSHGLPPPHQPHHESGG